MTYSRSIISLDNLRHNLGQVRGLIPEKARICLAVKADGYGHGAPRIAAAAAADGVDWFGIANIHEGTVLRESGITGNLLLFGLIDSADIPDLVRYAITPVTAEPGFIDAMEASLPPGKARFPVHIIVDTGMGRIGCPPGDTVELAKKITASSKIYLQGICTHFPNADTRDQVHSKEQLVLFNRAIEEVRHAGIDPGIIHAANSGAIIGLPESHFDMVRPGIMAYGYYPSKEQDRTVPLKPVMKLVSKVIFIKKVAPGTAISYGSTYKTKKTTNIATIAIGYADGYLRLLSNTGQVMIRGRRYPVVGRVTMDMIMADLGAETDVRPFDEAILFGPDDGAPTAETLADRCGTIPYEITCAVSKRVVREYVG